MGRLWRRRLLPPRLWRAAPAVPAKTPAQHRSFRTSRRLARPRMSSSTLPMPAPFPGTPPHWPLPEPPGCSAPPAIAAEDAAAIAAAAQHIPIIAAPNFCPGVNLLLLLSERLGAALPAARYDAEILEMHHRQKVDAPSGTALALGRAVAAGRGVVLEDVMVTSRSGHTGPRGENEIGFATLRGGQITGSHTRAFHRRGRADHPDPSRAGPPRLCLRRRARGTLAARPESRGSIRCGIFCGL